MPSRSDKIPVSVIVATKNEQARIVRCLDALSPFDEIIVADSLSLDDTAVLALAEGARVEPFEWNGGYPKKRQWCLENLDLAHDWVFFVDADEIVTPDLCAEISMIFAGGREPDYAGHFVKGLYVRGGQILRFGLHNNKLALFDRRKIEFPVVDDLDCPGMGEIEGHYQPVLKEHYQGEEIGLLNAALYHEAYGGAFDDNDEEKGGNNFEYEAENDSGSESGSESEEGYAVSNEDDYETWFARHERYARWEVAMDEKGAWPQDPIAFRRVLKRIFKALPCRGLIAFLHSYILKGGFMDGEQGFYFARDRMRYYRLIAQMKRRDR